MTFEFKLPDIGEGVHEGEISRWLVESGATVTEDQPMVEVMTDKVTVEITSPVAGTVSELLYGEGDVVKVGSVIIRIEESGVKSAAPKAEVAAAAVAAPTPSPVVNTPTSGPTTTPSMPTAARNGQKVLAPPAVRKLARSMGVDLQFITGSGPSGRIRKQDVLASSGSTGSGYSSAAVSFPSNGEKRVAFKGMRRKIAEHLVKSKQTAPHFTYVEEADCTNLVAMRDDLDAVAQAQGIKMTYLPFIIKAVIAGLRQYPTLNSSLDESAQEIILKGDYNIGIAVATDDGLVVPVIHQAQHLSIFQLAQKIGDLSQRARAGKLQLSDLQGGTFTLTSIGSIGGIFSAPIINYPEVAIMGIQKIEKRPVVRDDQIVIRQMSYFSISCDHRVVDGAEAALFMKSMIDALEHPARLLV